MRGLWDNSQCHNVCHVYTAPINSSMFSLAEYFTIAHLTLYIYMLKLASRSIGLLVSGDV